MSSGLLPQWHSASFFHRTSFLSSKGVLRATIFGAFALFGLLGYMTFLPQHSHALLRLSDWYGLSKTHSTHGSSSPSPPSEPDVLTLEQIRDIIAPTRGFFARDYSLGIGWNNVRYIMDAAVLEAELLNRTLVIPSFMYARACEYENAVCADYAPVVDKDKGGVYGFEDWRHIVEQRMGYRIPVSLLLDLSHLRSRHPVITVSEYLRLHGQDPEHESGTGMWQPESYHTHPNIFGSKTPTLFVLENHLFDPAGTIRVDYIPEEMKRRGGWERDSASDNQTAGGYWPEMEPTDISIALSGENRDSIIDWNTAKDALKSSGLDPEVDLDDDGVVEHVLNANGWEVLHTFFDSGPELERTIVSPIKQVVPRSSIRGFRDDYLHVDADVVYLTGVTHASRKIGNMRFTSASARSGFASMVVHSFIPPQRILDLAGVLAERMRALSRGRLWMGAHMRRGDFVVASWVMETTPEAHVKRVKDRLEGGRLILQNLTDPMTYEIEGVELNQEFLTLSPPLPDDLFYVATDERNPEALQVIKNAGAVLLSDLLTIEDRRKFGWPLLLTDVRGVVDQSVLAHSAYFYGHVMSSFAGAVVNKRAALGAERRTALLD